ncbi:MAG: hypothetical protein KAJ14_05005, partial [Candidatus Omnitrophica bacterium]|nr:hypothetical protein [Candidatus Omnitrophota bacterium]
MNKKIKTKTLKICCIAIVFIFTFTNSGIGGLVDEKLHQNADLEDSQVNNNQNAIVVTTSNTDQLITNEEYIPQDNNLSPIDNATSIASGYIQAGKSEDEVFLSLTDMGFTEVEAEIAYAKANAGLQTEDAASTTNSGSNSGTVVKTEDIAVNPASTLIDDLIITVDEEAIADLKANAGSQTEDAASTTNSGSNSETVVNTEDIAVNPASTLIDDLIITVDEEAIAD